MIKAFTVKMRREPYQSHLGYFIQEFLRQLALKHFKRSIIYSWIHPIEFLFWREILAFVWTYSRT